MKSKCILLVFFAISVVVCAKEFRMDGVIQPHIRIRENANYTDSGDFVWGFRRLKVSFNYDDSLLKSLKIKGFLSLDFANKEVTEIIRKAGFQATFNDYLRLQGGQFKVPFLYNDYCGSDNLIHSDRSFTSDHLRKELTVGGYQQGILLSGSLKEKVLSYSVGLFYSDDIDRKGYSGKEFFMIPHFKVAVEPLTFLSLSYGIIAPAYSAPLINGADNEKRFVLQAISVRCKAPKLYRTELDIFLGVDTADGKALMNLHPSYDENVSFSLYSNHQFSFPLGEGAEVVVALAGEFLNGLVYYDGLYHERTYNYALWTTAGISVKKRFGCKVSFNERFDRDFSPTFHKEIGLEVSYTPTFVKVKK